MSIKSDKILFKKPTIDYQGKIHKFRSFKKTHNTFTTTVICDIPNGIYEIDEEESNEDCIVVYLPIK